MRCGGESQKGTDSRRPRLHWWGGHFPETALPEQGTAGGWLSTPLGSIWKVETVSNSLGEGRAEACTVLITAHVAPEHG